MDPLAFARAESTVELQYLVSVAEKAIKAYEISQRNSARLIIKYLGESLGAKNKQHGVQGTN